VKWKKYVFIKSKIFLPSSTFNKEYFIQLSRLENPQEYTSSSCYQRKFQGFFVTIATKFIDALCQKLSQTPDGMRTKMMQPNNTSQSAAIVAVAQLNFSTTQHKTAPRVSVNMKRGTGNATTQYLFPEFRREKARIAKGKKRSSRAAASGRAKRAFVQFSSSRAAIYDNWGVHSFPLGGADINHGPFIPPFVGAASAHHVAYAVWDADVSLSLSYLAWTAALGTCWPGHITFTCRTPRSSCKIHPPRPLAKHKLSSRGGLLSSPEPWKRPLSN
jgi:hypothetical protein